MLLRLLLLSFLTSTFTSATESLTVCTLKLTGNMVKSEKEGFIIDLLQNGLGQDYELKINILPPIRAIQRFQNDKCDIFATYMENTLKDKFGNYYPIELPTGLEDYFGAFFTKNNKQPKFDTDTKKKIIAVKGWEVPKVLSNNTSIFSAMTLKGAIKMLQVNRADYLIGFNYLIHSHLAKHKIKDVLQDESIKVDLKSVVFVVRPSAHSEQIKKTYKDQLEKMLKDGTYEKLTKKNNVPACLLQDRLLFIRAIQRL